jgi:hypothetical protein
MSGPHTLCVANLTRFTGGAQNLERPESGLQGRFPHCAGIDLEAYTRPSECAAGANLLLRYPVLAKRGGSWGWLAPSARQILCPCRAPSSLSRQGQCRRNIDRSTTTSQAGVLRPARLPIPSPPYSGVLAEKGCSCDGQLEEHEERERRVSNPIPPWERCDAGRSVAYPVLPAGRVVARPAPISAQGVRSPACHPRSVRRQWR